MACCGMTDDDSGKKKTLLEIIKEEILMSCAFIISTIALFLPHRARIFVSVLIRRLAEIVPHRSIHSLRFDE